MLAAEPIRDQALALGFDACGFARVPGPDQPFAEGLRLREWLECGHAGNMAYLGRTAARRAEPWRIHPPPRTAVVLLKRHQGRGPEPGPGEGRVARYAWGCDYHNPMRRRARRLFRWLRQRWPETDGYISVDTGAVMEKAWAARAGLGWIGKNTLLLDPGRGSYTLLAVLLLNLEVAADPPQPDQCGDCRLCLDSCPTAAFPEPYVLDARRCISYHTIEHREDVPEELRRQFGDRLFGCDVCQEVCPWNRAAAAPEPWPESAAAGIRHESLATVLGVDEDGFVALFRGRPLGRAGRVGMVRSACVAAGNARDPALAAALERLAGDGSEVVRRHAAWALAEIGGGARPAPGA